MSLIGDTVIPITILISMTITTFSIYKENNGEFEYKTYNTRRLLQRLASWPEAMIYFEKLLIRGLCKGTIAKNLCDILSFLTFNNRPLDRITERDVHEWMMWEKKSFLKNSTFARRVITVKAFLKTSNRRDLANSIPQIRFKYQPKSMILTDKEINVILKVCKNDLEKTIIHLLHDTGCRIGELITLRKQDVYFDDLGIKIFVDGKTGKRPVRLINSVSRVKRIYRQTKDLDDLLFKGKGYDWAYWIFRRASKKLGKNINPHMFRHTKATELWKQLPDAIVKQYMGFSKDSKMAIHYNHLSSRDVDEALLKLRPKIKWAGAS